MGHDVGVGASVLRRMRGSGPLKVAARIGLATSAALYLALAALAANALTESARARPQANTNGVLSEVARSGLGLVLLAVAALGCAAFGLIRLAGAATDDREGALTRLGAAGQALIYLGMAASTVAFLLGRHGTGSEQQQRRTAGQVLGLPGGRALVVAVGLVVLAVCCWQLTVAVKGHFADTLHTEQMGADVHRTTTLLARVGIPARALAFVPVGVFLVIAGVQADPRKAKGLDGLLLDLTATAWGRVLVALMAVGFAVFSAYSFLEARYKQVSAGA